MALAQQSAVQLQELPSSVEPKKERKPMQVDFEVTRFDRSKRLFDLFVASMLLLSLFPVMLLTALLVRLTSKGPVIFNQERLTQGGKRFTMHKFRTMSCAPIEVNSVWTTDNDPRITSIGQFLRVTRLDELPQLLNVLKGEMSLIGPRPERPDIAQQLSEIFPSFNRRLQVKAGLTGLAQTTSGYAGCIASYRKKLAFDLLYIKHKCWAMDVRIALKTIQVVITGRGAR